MILAVDVHYAQTTAYVAGVCFAEWDQEQPNRTYYSTLLNVAPYEPGNFFMRELPCITKLISEHSLDPQVVVVDGYVNLPHGKPGLGKHLYDSMGGSVPVIGVAKNAYREVDSELELIRGSSRKALYVSAEGIGLEKSKELITQMHGQSRMPSLLKLVDRLARELAVGEHRKQ